jgi:hypothetical protein
MNDPRDAILDRIETLCGGVEGVKRATRNVTAIEDHDLPAICLLDGDEESLDEHPPGVSPRATVRVVLKPQIVIFARDRNAALVGPSLSTLRERLRRAILFDTQLQALVGPNGQMSYRGMQTAFAAGRSLTGEAIALFEFRYVLRFAQ